MAIRDLLWACPLCGSVGGLARSRGGDACRTCGASFRRVSGSAIQARLPDGRVQTRPSAEWAAALPPEPSPAGEGGRDPAGRAGGDRLWRRDRVLARFALGDEPIRLGGEFLGTMERLGPKRPGELALTGAALELRLDDGEVHRWPLEELSALQASSGTVQIRPRGRPIVSFAFPDSSARLWEESIAAALRVRWRGLGRGEIVEFQPRIVGRPAGRVG